MRPTVVSFYRLGRSLLLVLTVMLLATVAQADEAQDAFNLGMKELGQGKYDAACTAFEKSEAAGGGASVRTRYQLGRCNEEGGKLVKAHRSFLDAARLSDAEGDSKRAGVARQRAAEIAPKVALLVIDVPQAQRVAGLSIELDGEVVPEPQWGVATAVEPGDHAIEVAAPGQQGMTLRVSGEIGKKAQLTVPPFGSPAASASTTAPVLAPTGADDGEDKGGGTKFKSPGLFWTGLGLGVVGLLSSGGAAAFWFEQNEFNGEPPGGAIAGFVVSGVFLAVGIPFMVVGGKRVPDEPEPADALVVETLLSPAGGSLRLRF